MLEKELLADVDTLLKELSRKLEEANAIMLSLKAVTTPCDCGVRKKPTRRPQDIVREVLQ